MAEVRELWLALANNQGVPSYVIMIVRTVTKDTGGRRKKEEGRRKEPICHFDRSEAERRNLAVELAPTLALAYKCAAVRCWCTTHARPLRYVRFGRTSVEVTRRWGKARTLERVAGVGARRGGWPPRPRQVLGQPV